MGTPIDESVAAWDGPWRCVRIPLPDLRGRGSCDNDWFSPRGRHDWSAVDQFEIIAEHHALTGMDFWFDVIRVADPPGLRQDRGLIRCLPASGRFEV